jgi:hypothetical protein|tara:strand:+ start:174 stop:776 length:603 start_codon:yes stop_codon:yes gene_type:complete
MNKLCFLTLTVFFFISCGEDDVLEPIEAMIVTNLYAPETLNPGEPPSGEYVKFSFLEQKVVKGDDWDIAFRGTDILVNGGYSANSDEPARTGIGAAYIILGNYGSIRSVDESLLKEDSENSRAIKNESENGWYTIKSPGSLIVPIESKTLIFKTHNGKYAKMKIQSYYKNAPENPNPFIDQASNYTFNYTYQPNEGVRTF